MAPLTPVFEFAFYNSVASLESQLGESPRDLEDIAVMCDSGDAYERGMLRIRKKLRVISVPNRQLDAIQHRINALIFPLDLLMRPEVHGYVARRSTKTNASPHAGAKQLQKFDIKEFFSTITTAQIAEALGGVGFGQEAAEILARLVACEGHLPLGARTSPRVSNLVLGDFDDVMADLAAQKSLVYTRFADDLSFSGPRSFDVSSEVETELRARGFALNALKTKKFKHGQPMFVTGLAVSDAQFPRLRKRLKAQLRREFYYVEKYGVEGHARRVRQDPRGAASRIMGQFHYARSIEPAFANRLEVQYPSAFRALIPVRSDERIERAERYRQQFLDEVTQAPSVSLAFYIPSVELPLR